MKPFRGHASKVLLVAGLLLLECPRTKGQTAVFEDGFDVTLNLSPDPQTDINAQPVPRRTGSNGSGAWTEATASGGVAQPKDAYLAEGVSQLDQGVLLLRTAYNTSGGTISVIGARTHDLQTALNGSKYTVSSASGITCALWRAT